MKKFLLIFAIVAMALAVSLDAMAATIYWEGLTWTIRGTNNSAAVQGDGSIDISVLPGDSGDPSPDNWALTAPLPSTTQWVEFSFIDETGAGGATVPRAYVDTSHDGGSTLIQGGGFSGYNDAYINRHWYKDGDWLVNEWINLGSRTAGSEHIFKVGRRSDGSIDLYYDGVLEANVTDVDPPFFGRAYLGVQASTGTSSVIGKYTGFSYGDTYVPVPVPSTVLLLGSGLLGLVGFGRKKFFKKSL